MPWPRVHRQVGQGYRLESSEFGRAGLQFLGSQAVEQPDCLGAATGLLLLKRFQKNSRNVLNVTCATEAGFEAGKPRATYHGTEIPSTPDLRHIVVG